MAFLVAVAVSLETASGSRIQTEISQIQYWFEILSSEAFCINRISTSFSALRVTWP